MCMLLMATGKVSDHKDGDAGELSDLIRSDKLPARLADVADETTRSQIIKCLPAAGVMPPTVVVIITPFIVTITSSSLSISHHSSSLIISHTQSWQFVAGAAGN